MRSRLMLATTMRGIGSAGQYEKWMWSVKLDGVRGWWPGYGACLYTRDGIPVAAPARVLRRLPLGVPAEGEITSRAGLDRVKSAIQRGGWRADMRISIFDLPGDGIFTERISRARSVIDCGDRSSVCVVDHHVTGAGKSTPDTG